MGNDVIAAKIRNLSDPAEQKREGQRVKGDLQKWIKDAKPIVYKAILAKFQQNQDLQAYLLSTSDKLLSEASRDTTWGTGYQLGDQSNLDSNLWQGTNWLGDLLMNARQELK